MRSPLPFLLSLFCGCQGTMQAGGGDLGPPSPLIAARPYESMVPRGYDPSRPTPLVLLLHGYGASGVVQDALFGLSKLVDDQGFLYAYPDGSLDGSGHRFWNATDACCDFGGTGVDDVAYLDAVIADMSAHYNVDPKRIYVTGHSNGGYMAHRYACDRADRVAAIVPLAGDNWKDPTRCRPSQAVAVLQVHGDADQSVLYEGDATSPSAQMSVASWAKLDGCGDATDQSGPPIDIVQGKQTTSERWTGCKGGAAELWTIHGGSHIPNLKQPQWPQAIWSWFAAHKRP